MIDPYALLTTSGHTPDEMVDGVLGVLLPDLDQGVSELLDSLWSYLAAVDAPIRDIPEVLNWIQVWGTMASMPSSSRNCLPTLAT